MSKLISFLIFIVVILFALVITNPSDEDHRQAVLKKMKERLNASSSEKSQLTNMGQKIGMAFAQQIVENGVVRKNYTLFSITTLSLNGISKDIGYGVFGKVWISEKLTEEEPLLQDTNSASQESSNLYTDLSGLQLLNETRYGTSEDALKFQKEFSQSGWRIPNLGDYDKIEPHCANLENLRGKRFWCINYFGQFEEIGCQNCEGCPIDAYSQDEFHIILVRDPN